MKNESLANLVESNEFQHLSGIVANYIANVYENANTRDVYIDDKHLAETSNDIPPLPLQGQLPEEVLNQAFSLLDSGFCNVQNSGYYGYISSRPLLLSLIGDFLASSLNQTAGAWRAGPAATVIENHTLKWIAEFIGYSTQPNEPAGIITNGGTMANASALKLARDIKLGRAVQENGLDCSVQKPAIYLSEQGHFSIKKSLDFLGLGKNSLKIINVNEKGQMDLDVLTSAIESDIAAGFTPICIVATAGTTATGAIDDLQSLSQIAKKYAVWFHVDAAAGGVYGDHPLTKHHFLGMDLADSVTIDPCKWLFVPFGIGCLLVKEPKELFESFKITANYWEEKNELDFFQMSFPGTRQWRTLGLWMIFKSLGKNGYHQLLGNMLALKDYLVDKLDKSDTYEILENPLLPVCCFRFISKSVPLSLSLNDINTLLCSEINKNNKHHVTLMDYDDKVFLRVAFSNPEASTHTIDELLSYVENLASHIILSK